MKTIIKPISGLFIAAMLGACSNNPDKSVKSLDTIALDTSVSIEAQKIEASDTSLLLSPGIGAGKVLIGQDAEQVYKELGKPDDGDAAMQKAVAIWYKDHDPKSYATSIYTVRDTGENPPAFVRQIRVTSPAFKTQDGIGVSSSLKEIKEKYQVSKLEVASGGGITMSIYDSLKGIAFEMDDHDICSGIIIHTDNEALKPSYLPLR